MTELSDTNFDKVEYDTFPDKLASVVVGATTGILTGVAAEHYTGSLTVSILTSIATGGLAGVATRRRLQHLWQPEYGQDGEAENG